MIRKQPNFWLVVFLFLALSSSLGMIGIKTYSHFASKNISSASEGAGEKPQTKNAVRRLLDGIEVENNDQVNPAIFAVQVENMVDSRPLSGLSKANLVYETLVEGGITRFLALYASDSIAEEIGPIRSFRLYYLDWAEEYGAFYAHLGGSPEALENIFSYNILNIDEYSNGKYYWRLGQRYAPHNLYTSMEFLNKAFEENGGMAKENFDSWQFKAEVIEYLRPQEEKRVNIDFSTASYEVGWQYGRGGNDYLRYQAAKIQRDKDGSEVRAKNVVVQFTDMMIIDSVGRERIKTIGKGEAIVFQDGIKIEGEWRKEKRGDRTKFYDKTGAEIKFNPGVTWIEVVPIGTEISYGRPASN